MNTENPFLDSLFDSLSSIYRTDNGMVHSSLFTLFNAPAESFEDVQRKLDQIQENTYIDTAEIDALEDNFGILIDFPKPPRLNTLSNGDETYRAMLKSLYQVFQSGSTNASMEEALNVTASYLTLDPRTDNAVVESNFAKLLTVDDSIEITYRAVDIDISGNITGPASISNITFAPQDLIVTSYDDNNKIIGFTGTVDTGTNYQIRYLRDNTTLQGTNTINITDTTETNVNPLRLSDGPENTFNNPEFSYWWNAFNEDGLGVDIDEFKISRSDSSLAWRLPEKTIQFISPFSNQQTTKTIEFYNLSGTAFDITKITESNPDILFVDEPVNYYTDISPRFENYYIRYSQNNQGTQTALAKYDGALPKFTKRYNSIEFPADNSGTLDFFESGTGFDLNDLFGKGTKNIWLNVPNQDSKYILNNDFLFDREYSLHQEILFEENFENGTVDRFTTNFPSGMTITDLVGVPFKDKENNLTLASSGTGVSIYAYPILSSGVVLSGNNVQIDFFDALNSGTQTFIDVIRTGTNGDIGYHHFRFGMDNNAAEFQFSLLDEGVLDTKPFQFVETYFPTTGNIGYALTATTATPEEPPPPGGFELPPVPATPGYVLVPGNPHSIDSTMSAVITGNATQTVGTWIANVDPNIISASNTLDFEYTDDGTGTGEVAIEITIIDTKIYGWPPVAPGFFPPSFPPVPPPGSPSINLGSVKIKLYSDGSPFWKWKRTEIAYGPPPFFLPLFSSPGGDTTIPFTVGTNKIRINRGEDMVINGVTYDSTDFWNLGNHWGKGNITILGTRWHPYDPAFGFSTTPVLLFPGNPLGITVSSTTDETIAFNHYFLGNEQRKEDFTNHLNEVVVAPIPTPYFYQVFTNPEDNAVEKNYLTQIPREFTWRKLTFDFGIESPGRTVDDFGIIEASGTQDGDAAFSGNWAGEALSRPNVITINNVYSGNDIDSGQYSRSRDSSAGWFQSGNTLFWTNGTDYDNFGDAVAAETIPTPVTEKYYIDYNYDSPDSYNQTTVSLDEVKIFEEADIGFSGNIASENGVTMTSISKFPQTEFSYFDNVTISRFDKNRVLDMYKYTPVLHEDWEGSYLSQSTVLDNKFFEQDPNPNFQFNVIIKGLDEAFIFIMNDLIQKLKPAHTIAQSIFKLEQKLDTTSEDVFADETTDWETGNIGNNIIVKSTGQSVSPEFDDPGFITISGTTP